jgi:serine/threonine-protein kinase
MSTTTPHSPPESTGAYRPAGDTTGRPAVELVARSGPLRDAELVPLLHKRLRFLVLVFTVFYVIVTVLAYVQSGSIPQASRLNIRASTATAVALLGLLAILSSRRRMTLRQLRAVELVLFAIFVARMGFRAYAMFWEADYMDRVHAWLAAGDVANAREMMTGLAHRWHLPCAMFVVAYGVIIPNTWQRCALVVAAFTIATIATWIVACADRGLPTGYWVGWGFMISALVSIQIAILSVYGAYRIERSRQEAAEARRLGQYVLREKLGGGGMGEVYLADHVLLRRPCAIKLIHPARAGDPAMLQRFEREVRSTATLTHPNTVQVYDYGHTPDGTFYYVMEYLPGPTLEELVRRDGPLPPGRVIHFLRQLCGALDEAHAVGLIHRDIKPGNVIVCTRGRVSDVAKLLDFGLVQSAVTGGDERLTHVGAVLGTPAYLSPEQAAGDAVDGRTDIYGLGALAYFLLAGQPPFVRKGPVQLLAAHLHEKPEPPGRLRADIVPELEAVVLRCLAKKPEERFPDVRALDRALAACGTAGRPTSPSPV